MMKHIYSKALFTLLLLSGVFACYNTHAQSWATVGSAGFSDTTAYSTSMVMNSSGTPYVLFQDQGNGNHGTVMSYSGGSWTAVGGAGFTPNQVAFPAITLDTNGVPYVVYSAIDGGGAATVLKYNGGGWATVGGAYMTGLNTTYTAIAIDTTDNVPFVVYVDGTNYYKATVKIYDAITNAWYTLGGTGFSAGEAYFCNIAINQVGTPYVVYQDATSGYRATVMKYSGGSWQLVGNQGFSAGRATNTTIAINSQMQPVVSYADGAHAGKATCMAFNGASWVTIGNAGFSDTNTYYNTMVVKGDTPYVAYSDGGDTDVYGPATVMKYNGSWWQQVCQTDISQGIAWYTSVAMSPGGIPYIAYLDWANHKRATVLAYDGNSECFPTAVTNVVAGNTLSIFPNPAYNELTIQSTSEPITKVCIMDLLGQTVSSRQFAVGGLQQTLNVAALSAGVYFVQVNNTEVRKFVKE